MLKRPTDSKLRVLHVFRAIGKFNRMRGRYELNLEILCAHKNLKQMTKEKVSSAIDSLIHDGAVKLIGYNTYSCDSSVLENLNASVE